MGNKKGKKDSRTELQTGKENKKRKGTGEGHTDGNVPEKRTVLSDGEK